MTLGKAVGFVVSAVIGYMVGAFIVSRVPPLAALLQTRSA
jgi:hypothetical protein